MGDGHESWLATDNPVCILLLIGMRRFFIEGSASSGSSNDLRQMMIVCHRVWRNGKGCDKAAHAALTLLWYTRARSAADQGSHIGDLTNAFHQARRPQQTQEWPPTTTSLLPRLRLFILASSELHHRLHDRLNNRKRSWYKPRCFP